MTGLVVALVVVVLVALAVWAAARMRHPEQTATHPDDLPGDTTSDRFYRGTDRPAGPDAEDASYQRPADWR